MKKILFTIVCASSFLCNAQKVDFIEYDLDNGLHVILHQDNSAPVVSTVLQYHVGSKDEAYGIKGFAHLFEHMLGQETKNMKSGEWFKIYRARGGNGNASTSVDLTSYYVTLPSNSLELALWRYSEIMLHPVIDQKTIDVQREAVKEEKRQRDNQPYSRFYTYLKESFFEVHPYKSPLIGLIEDLDNSSLEDFINFKESFYPPSNAVFVIAGDIDIEKTKMLVADYFNEIPNKGPKPKKEVYVENTFKEKRVKEYDPNIQIPALFYAFRTPAETERDSSVLEYISTYLSGGESSILYKKLVDEKQMALAVQAINLEQEDYSMFAILILPQGETSFEDLIYEVEIEINKIQEEMISENDYQKIQNNLENIFVSSLGSVSGISQSLASYHNIHGDASMINKIADIFRSVSREEIKDVANKYLSKNQRLIMEYLPETNE
tara:strand:- start:1551 stop:2858 length:1308 start_codon:yes stop_codon:yes gene_type:complete